MDILKRIWQSIVQFFSPTKEDWKNFRAGRRSDSDGGYTGGYDDAGDCGTGGGDCD